MISGQIYSDSLEQDQPLCYQQPNDETYATIMPSYIQQTNQESMKPPNSNNYENRNYNQNRYYNNNRNYGNGYYNGRNNYNRDQNNYQRPRVHFQQQRQHESLPSQQMKQNNDNQPNNQFASKPTPSSMQTQINFQPHTQTQQALHLQTHLQNNSSLSNTNGRPSTPSPSISKN